MAQKDGVKDHVTLSQCSNRSIPSEDEALPMLSPRNLKRVKARPKLANTTSREIRLTPVPYFPFLEKVESELNENFTSNYDEGPQYEQQWKPVPTEQNHTGVRMVTLPRLNDADKKQNCLTTRSMDTDYIRLPEISTISKRNGRLALNRSITDLLDPEMEILNKIRHVPKKKRKRRKKFDCGTPV